MQKPNGTILLVEDTETIRQILSVGLGERGYNVVSVPDGDEAFGAMQLVKPDLVLLDINLPGMDGYEICKRIKQDPLCHHVPVIMLTSLEETGFEIMALEAGADDFVTKPIDPVVLDARMNMIIRRTRRERFANPLTGLPGGVIVEQRIASSFEAGRPFAVGHVDLDDFKAYNDRYGFPRGDELLAHTARVIADCAGYTCRIGVAPGDPGLEEVLVGHPGGDDFIYVCAADRAERIAQGIVDEFDESIRDFYEPADAEQGYIVVEDRRGDEQRHDIMTVSVAIISTATRTFWSPLEMADVARELKAYAKSLPGSVVVKDRRTRDANEARDQE